MGNKKDFNRIKEWLDPLLDARGLSVEKFANLCGLTKTVIYFYRQDKKRPTEQAMVKMCQVLGRPLEEGLAQYTPNKMGRPKGTGSSPRAVTVGGRR